MNKNGSVWRARRYPIDKQSRAPMINAIFVAGEAGRGQVECEYSVNRWLVVSSSLFLLLLLPGIVSTMVGTLGKLTALFHGNSGSKSSSRRPSVVSTPPSTVALAADKPDGQHLQRWSSLRLHRRKARQQGKYCSVGAFLICDVLSSKNYRHFRDNRLPTYLSILY